MDMIVEAKTNHNYVFAKELVLKTRQKNIRIGYDNFIYRVFGDDLVMNCNNCSIISDKKRKIKNSVEFDDITGIDVVMDDSAPKNYELIIEKITDSDSGNVIFERNRKRAKKAS